MSSPSWGADESPGRTRSVLHVAQPTDGGVARCVADLAADQVSRGWRVTVACPEKGSLPKWTHACGATFVPWSAERGPGPHVFGELRALRKIVTASRPDIVHLHSSKAGLVGRIMLRRRTPTVFQPHAWSFEAVTGCQRTLSLAWERTATRWADITVCVSVGERERGEAFGIAGRYRVVHNGVDLKRFTAASAEERAAARSRLGLPDAPLVVCVGRLCSQKGQDVLLAAWPAVRGCVPRAEAVLVGPDEFGSGVDRSQIAGIRLAGQRDDVPDWLAAADVVALPSRYEGMPLALLEAMARGRSVVATDVAGVRETLSGSCAGAVVPVEDASALANALVERLSSPLVADTEGRAGQRRAAAIHRLADTTGGIAQVYEEALAARDGKPQKQAGRRESGTAWSARRAAGFGLKPVGVHLARLSVDETGDLPNGRPAKGPKSRPVARNAVVIAAAEVVGKVATLLMTIVAARTIGTAGFGAFSYALSYALLVAALPAWGFDLLLVQRGSADPHQLSRFLSETVVLRTAVAIPVFLGAALGGAASRPDARSAAALVLILAATFVDLYSESGRSVAAARQNQQGVSAALAAQRVSTAALAIASVMSGFGLLGLAAAYFAGTVIGAIGVLLCVRRFGIAFDKRAVRVDEIIRTARLSVALGIDSVVALVLFRMDHLLLGLIKGDDAVGTYAAAYRLIETVMFVSWAVARASFPAMSAASEPSSVRRAVQQGITAVSVVYLPFGVGLGIEADRLLRLIYGDSYAQGASAARWLAATPMLFALGYLGSYALLACGRRWHVAAATAVATAYNIGANVVLIPHLSGTGAAFATTTAYALEAVLVLALLARRLPRIDLHKMLAVPVLAAAAMAGVLFITPYKLSLDVPLGVTAYAVTWCVLARWRQPDQFALIASALSCRR